jgi:hypothetical protein
LRLPSEAALGETTGPSASAHQHRLFWVLQWGSSAFSSVFCIISSVYFLQENVEWSVLHLVSVLTNWFYWYCVFQTYQKRHEWSVPLSSTIDACMVLLNFFTTLSINLLLMSCIDSCSTSGLGVAACPRGSPLAVMNIVLSSTVLASTSLAILAKICTLGLRGTCDAVLRD